MHWLCDFFIKIMKYLDNESMIVFGIFSSNPLNLMLYLTLIPKGIGGEIAPLSFCKPKKVLIETFKVFSMTIEYFKWEKFNWQDLTIFWQNLLQKFVFSFLISFMFLHIFFASRQDTWTHWDFLFFLFPHCCCTNLERSKNLVKTDLEWVTLYPNWFL